MPQALPVDRSVAKELYINGMPRAQIARKLGVQLGTICKWVERGGWDCDKLVPTSDANDAIAQAAKALSNQTLTIAQRVLNKLEKLPMTSSREAKDIATGLSSAYLTARKALGLDDEARARSVSVTFINAGVSEQAPVIDITPEPNEVTGPAEPAAIEPSHPSEGHEQSPG